MNTIKLTDKDVKILLECIYKAIRWDSDLIVAHENCGKKWIESYKKDLKTDINLSNKIKKQLDIK